jgi:hypothetical protein
MYTRRTMVTRSNKKTNTRACCELECRRIEHIQRATILGADADVDVAGTQSQVL